MNTTIIIPTLNERTNLNRLLRFLLDNGTQQDKIIVVDGGSKDGTRRLADSFGVTVLLTTSSRAVQMNMGAQAAQTEWLYFLHADTLPPADWSDDLCFLESHGLEAGTYRAQYEKGPSILRLNAFFTRFNWTLVRGGDQSLFIMKSVFDDLGQFPENMVVMEEYPLIEKLYSRNKFKLFNKRILISTRKYCDRSWLKVSRANFVAFRMYKKGMDTRQIKKRYLELLG